MKAVFALRDQSGYDDDPFTRYHFPNNGNNKKIADEAVRDWIIYYRSGTGLRESAGGRSYTACARVIAVEPAASHPDGGFYARIADYTEFEHPLSFRKDGDSYFETRGIGNRAHWQRSLRALSDEEFSDIVQTALGDLFDPESARKHDIDTLDADVQALFYTGPMTIDRPIEQVLLNKKVRERNFQKNVRAAYRNRCAVTRFDLNNGGGRPEVQACHILPVENNGPDVVQNGVALSGTVHWMFDRGLISFTRDRRLLISHNTMPEHLRSILEAHRDDPWFPPESNLQPRDDFMEWHRDMKFGRHEQEAQAT